MCSLCANLSADQTEWLEHRRNGEVELWHPDSPGIRVWVRPSLLRRLGVIRSPFATLGETARHYRRGRHAA